MIQFFDQIYYYNSINELNDKDLDRARCYLVVIEKDALTDLNVFFIR